MRRVNPMKLIAVSLGILIVGGALVIALIPRAQFLLGGGLVNAGLRMQDRLEAYDFVHETEISAEQVWEEFRSQNALAAEMRRAFPRSERHPLVAMLVCMDARIDTNELAGDTRHYYYVLRTAGSVLNVEEQEMLELAVRNGVKLLLLTRHTDCAAEKAAELAKARELYPALVEAVTQRQRRVREFLARPFIAEKVAKGELLVKELVIDTSSERLVTSFPVDAHAAEHVDH